jgi:hypothetical protein
MLDELNALDLSKDQPLLSIRQNGECIGYVEILDGKLVTSGDIGEGNTYDNFVGLIWGLQGFGITIDDFFF